MFSFRRLADTGFAIDPFGHLPQPSSAIVGLAPASATDPALVFHTAYAAYGWGRLRFVAEFSGFAAESGTLVVQLLKLAAGSDEATVVTTRSIDVRQARDGALTVGLATWTHRGNLYAMRATLIDGREVEARSVAVHASRRSDASFYAQAVTEARTRIFATPTGSGLVVDATATLTQPRSQMCTAAQFDEADYRRWLDLLHRPMHRHRKQWEYVYICRVLEHLGALQPLGRGIGFGCGIEPLPAAFAAHNIFVTATDLPTEDPRSRAWHGSDQLLTGLVELRDAAIVPDHVFDARVEYAPIDMTAIPAARRDYDFCWSSCSLEHLGTLEAGLRFFEASLATLKPGGVAVHTTELNLSSDDATISAGGTVLYRRRDIVGLAERLAAAGHEVLPLTFDQGDQPDDRHIDMAPYRADNHLKLALGRFVSTSFGLAVRKAT